MDNDNPLTEREVREWFVQNVKDGLFGSLVIDSEKRLGNLRDFAPSRCLYIDCGELRDGDLEVCAMAMRYPRLKSLVLDNIDRIPEGIANRSEWEHIVKYALRDEDWEVCDGIELPLDSLYTIARCSEFPGYLKNISLYARIYDFNQFRIRLYGAAEYGR